MTSALGNGSSLSVAGTNTPGDDRVVDWRQVVGPLISVQGSGVLVDEFLDLSLCQILTWSKSIMWLFIMSEVTLLAWYLNIQLLPSDQ